VDNSSFSPTSLPAFVVLGVIDDSHSECSEVKSRGHIDLHFLYGQGFLGYG
jgi:hypothetical protein